MTTRVRIENISASGHDIDVYEVSVDNLAGKRITHSERKVTTLKPGGLVELYVHMCQDLKVVEKR